MSPAALRARDPDLVYSLALTSIARPLSRPVLIWALTPIALLLVAIGSAQLRDVSPRFIYPEAVIFWPAWNVSFWMLGNDEPGRAWLFAMNLPYYYLLLSPVLAFRSRNRAVRVVTIVLLLALVMTHLFVGAIMANIAYEFAYGDHNFIPR